MKVPDIDYKGEIKKCKTLDDVVGKGGLILNSKLFDGRIATLFDVKNRHILNNI